MVQNMCIKMEKMLDFINQIIYNNKELKGEDDGDESLNNSPINALKCSLDLLTNKSKETTF